MERTWKRGTRRKGKESRTSRARNIHPSRVYNAGTDEAPCATVNFSLSLLSPTYVSPSFFFLLPFLPSLPCYLSSSSSAVFYLSRGEEGRERREKNRIEPVTWHVVMYKEECFAGIQEKKLHEKKKNANVANCGSRRTRVGEMEKGKDKGFEESELETCRIVRISERYYDTLVFRSFRSSLYPR